MVYKETFDINFAVENDKAVVCYAHPLGTDSKTEEIEAIYDYIFDNAPYPQVMPAQFKGVAVRKDGDENDIETAKEIARKKAIRAAYKGIYNYNAAMLDKIYSFMTQNWAQLATLRGKIDSLTDEIVVLAKEGITV